MIYDVRKPSIILKDVYRSILSDGTSEENEINDFDFVKQADNQVKISISFDSGETRVLDFDSALEEPEERDRVWLKNKHTNICLKCKFSQMDPSTIYTCGFDFKIIQWNLSDISNKSQSRNIFD